MNAAAAREPARTGGWWRPGAGAARRGAQAKPRRGQPVRWSARPAAIVAAATVAAATILAGCTAVPQNTAPKCGDAERLAIVAQSVPGASYVPCITGLPQGWRVTAFDPARGGTNFLLQSDRDPARPVRVRLTAGCDFAHSTPEPARAPGVTTYLWLDSISPRFTGTLYDVFPGGCVTYGFDFVQGPDHIALMEQWEGAIGLYPRQQLRLDLRKELGVELDP